MGIGVMGMDSFSIYFTPPLPSEVYVNDALAESPKSTNTAK